MREYLSQNLSQIGDGLLFGLGVLAVYLGAVFTGALIRSLGGAGSKGLTMAGRYVQGAAGYDCTLVNGAVFMEHGEHTGELAGQLLRNAAAD